MFDFNGENLQVGDKVIVYASYFSSKSYYVGTVVKRTPTGLLDIEWGNGKKERFKSNGYEYHRSSGYGRTSLYLEPYTEERGRQVIQENKRKCMVHTLRHNTDHFPACIGYAADDHGLILTVGMDLIGSVLVFCRFQTVFFK